LNRRRSCKKTKQRLPPDGKTRFSAHTRNAGLHAELFIQGAAVITLPNDRIAQQADSGSRGKGKFDDMYGDGDAAFEYPRLCFEEYFLPPRHRPASRDATSSHALFIQGKVLKICFACTVRCGCFS